MSTTTESFVSQGKATEDYPLSPVPEVSRRSLISLAPILVGFTLYSGTLFAGGLIGPSFQFWPNLVALIVIGNLILGLYAALLGYIAGQTGLSTVLMARFSFGNVGSRWVDFILGFTQIGWYAWGSALMAQLLNTLAGVPESWNWLIILFFTYAFCSTAYFGYQAMDWLSRVAVPAMVLLMLMSLTVASRDVGGFTGLQQAAIADPLPLGAAITIIVGTFVSGGTQATNWSRFAKNGKMGFIATLIAFFLGNGFLIFSGAFCAKVYGEPDIVKVMAQQGLVVGGLILFFLNMWTTQDNTIYAFSIAGSNMFRSGRRTLFVLGGATIALFMAWGGIYEGLVQYLILLGTFIPPIGGIIMADYWIYRRGQFPSLETPQPAFNWPGVIAYLGASASAYLTGLAGWGIVPVNGIVSALVIYVVLSRVLPSRSVA
ncbi:MULTISPECIES: cytosine permease [Cyanophyceae]|uniref:cytosine permease n=1 Tax=Cyanophyceae TaxID=3028117 RepID=UPI0016835676|nr:MULTISPECIES: cytosine permease [Cyanophyceae]MBD1915157.1 cytosine permease [Phormidium sp. FACHB-77]MBD2030924.1 cytosine permease [Phormidium sp. FACHB-322]MBD2050729.1 cytosine permease [Leptolyngbya sp. FACHB-60]